MSKFSKIRLILTLKEGFKMEGMASPFIRFSLGMGFMLLCLDFENIVELTKLFVG